MFVLHEGDNLEILAQLEDDSIDSAVVDPPYGLAFMGKKWDYDVPTAATWAEVLRVLKPGGHLLAFGGTRTYHRLVVNIEDAGFEIRDQVAWVYGSGFPKSHDIGKAIDKAAGADRPFVGYKVEPNGRVMAKEPKANGRLANPSDKDGRKYGSDNRALIDRKAITAPATAEAAQWDGWGTALKPAFEPIALCRKPIATANIAQNVLTYGTGGINVDGCRV